MSSKEYYKYSTLKILNNKNPRYTKITIFGLQILTENHDLWGYFLTFEAENTPKKKVHSHKQCLKTSKTTSKKL